MPISTTTLNFTASTPRSLSFHHHPDSSPFFSHPSVSFSPKITNAGSLVLTPNHRSLFIVFSTNAAATNSEIDTKFSTDGVNGGTGGSSGGGGGGGDNNDGNESNDDKNKKRNKDEALMALAEAGRSLESLPKDLKAAIEDGRIPGSIVLRYFDLEKSGFLSWLMNFGGFKERLLADDLFLAKVGIECGVGLFTKTAAEYQRRKENFFNELEIVFADVVMAIIADFMLVYLPAPTVSLRPPLGLDAGRLAKFFYSCPDNAFQIALPGYSFSLMQRIGAIARNGAKLFAVGTTSSLVGTVVTNALINARKAVDHSDADEKHNVPILSTSVAYGVYMAVSSNLRSLLETEYRGLMQLGVVGFYGDFTYMYVWCVEIDNGETVLL
ncbi:hypothetical protein DH2020_024572 [Rehmannia glutinosa]|uniref:Uncharacterized protein n=1 Tax=Rehmannia glutinosa TaxID=99300 RepID=A0ABR0W6I5_REHGL